MGISNNGGFLLQTRKKVYKFLDSAKPIPISTFTPFVSIVNCGFLWSGPSPFNVVVVTVVGGGSSSVKLPTAGSAIAQ